MLKLTWFSLKNRSAIVIMCLLISALGVYAGQRLPMEFLPSIDNPMVTVTTLAEGMDSETMTATITEPMEQELRNVKGVESVKSVSGQGISKIDLSFNMDSDMKEVTAEVERKTNNFPLPEGVNKPYVIQLNTSMIPIMDLTVNKDSAFTTEDYKLIEEAVIPQLEGVEGVSDIGLYGKATREITLRLNQKKLLEKKVTAPQIMAALQGKDVSLPAGNVSLEEKTNTLRVLGEMKDLEAWKNIIVAPGVVLKDIAELKDEQRLDSVTHVDGKDAMYLSVTKEASANAVQIGDEVRKKMKEINKQYGNDFKLTVFYATSDSVYDSVMSMAKEVALGALFASVVILLFLRHFKSTVIAVISIPLSICLTLFLLHQSGITLNVLTLGGLAVAVGRLVDDSIVVIENIFRRLQTGERSKELIVDSVGEVAKAITSSTITTIAVFLPVGLVEGALGVFFLPFALTMVYSLLASLLVALTVVPLMSYRMLKNMKETTQKPPRRYLNILNWSLNHKWIVSGLCIVLFAGSIALYVVMPAGSMASADESIVNVKIEYPEDTSFEDVKTGTYKLEENIINYNGVASSYSQVGVSSEMAQWGAAQGNNVAILVAKMEKGADTQKFIEDIKAFEKEYAPATISAGMASMMGGSSDVITLNITAQKLADLGPMAEKLTSELKEVKGLENVQSNNEDLKNEWVLNVDQTKAQEAGLTPADIAQQVRGLTGKSPVGQISLDGVRLPVMMSYDLSDVKDRDDLLNTIIFSPVKGPVALKDIAALNLQPAKAQVFRKDGKEYLQVTGIITDKNVKKVNMDVSNILKGIEKPAGVSVALGGAGEEMNEQFMDLFMTMGAAILIVYLIMVVTFGQARAPFAILFSLPLAAVGAILALVISRIPVDISSLIGALMLIGIVVTNAIVFIDRVQQQREKGMDVRDSILEAGSTRLRPILMTAVATICAMIPLMFGGESGSLVSKSLAIVVIGGLSVSTLLTLVVVPVIYEMLANIGNLFKRKNKKQTTEAA
ncbi:efflux RND transporter permease subunit [Fictibacillus nanhaiensis]|uniref:efflux RND transporter permease subunit n=1 Tax=Fictibacillus nanhaiensis TaxID=742169 RepID=UPI001C941430|nr:efflux RND transporter permease subunit [Fictibacillus nanhaiensis]MBY6038300.1 efflux RND transporter permease subunit [Fictibacillus nanhaiensis]